MSCMNGEETNHLNLQKTYGNGHTYYVAADMEYVFYHDLYKRLVKEAEVKLLVKFVPEEISVNTRACLKN